MDGYNNQAAWLKEPKAQLVIEAGPDPKAGPGEVVIKNAFVAINPVDWKLQAYAPPSQTYPAILGRDVAGEIVEIGEGVTRLMVGQRVIAHALGRLTGDAKHGGFQLYTVGKEITVAPIPDSLSYENAVVLPLAISTAAAGLYQKNFLELPYPTIDPKPSGKAILVWGGASSVGGITIQFAVASGLEVISTASKKNFDHVKSLGAKHVLDYSEPSVVEDLVALLKGKEFVGVYDAISSSETVKASVEIVSRFGGGKVVIVLGYSAEVLPSNVNVIGVSSVTIASDQKEVGEAVWGKYVPAALETGQLLAKPDPITIKGGLSHMQEAVDTLHKGVSANKVVVEL